MVPGWKGGKALPFGGSFGEYSLNDFEEQPRRERKKGCPKSLLGALLKFVVRLCGQGLVFWSHQNELGEGAYPRKQLPLILNLASILFY